MSENMNSDFDMFGLLIWMCYISYFSYWHFLQ